MSLALTGLLLGAHPDEPARGVLAATKAHLGQFPQSLGFQFHADTPTVPEWVGAVDLRADELCAARTGLLVRAPVDRAADFLRRTLRNGPRSVAELQELATKKGLAWRTVERARRKLKVLSQRGPRSVGSMWRLTDDDSDAAAPGAAGGTDMVYGPVVNVIWTDPPNRSATQASPGTDIHGPPEAVGGKAATPP
jgi:hypothetical protein